MLSIVGGDFNNKRVLVRCDFNAPMLKNKVLDNFKIRRSLQTIRFLLSKNAKVILLSHLAEPENAGFFKKKKFTLKPIALELEKLLSQKVFFVDKTIGNKARLAVENLKAGQILLLENTRLNKGETKNDEHFARALASLGDVFVNEAFSVCHRNHASIVGLPKLMTSFAGIELYEEVGVLTSLMMKPARPFAMIIGGAKIEDKISVLKNFIEKADFLLFGGRVANLILNAKGFVFNEFFLGKQAREFLAGIDLTSPKIRLPFDVKAIEGEAGGENTITRTIPPAKLRKEENVFDIGPETIEMFQKIISQAKTIFWAGVLGKTENPQFRKGSEAIARAITSNKEALKVAGGGETVAFLRQVGLDDEFFYLSTGGSAMLEFMAGKKLPGLEALG
ncbi:MAG: phosphoglycerate kinase [Patescibacteria group bacterium]|nr:phosphoglycerate kinase [Patescibacteria group bacterium]